MNIVFCHGVLGPDEDWENREYNPIIGWAHWTQLQIEKQHDVLMQIPLFPHAHAMLMKYDEWEKIMDCMDINKGTVLIGHSAGGGFVLKYLAQHPELHIRQVILVAPWLDAEDFQPFGFYKDFHLDDTIVARSARGIDLMISDDDMSHINSSFDKITKNMPSIRIHWFSGYAHFVRPELPEIMPIIQFD